MKRIVGTISGRFSKKRLEDILGKPSWNWERIEAEQKDCECGLREGTLKTAGWGNSTACARLWIHSNGICFTGGLTVDEDRAYALQMYKTVEEA